MAGNTRSTISCGFIEDRRSNGATPPEDVHGAVASRWCACSPSATAELHVALGERAPTIPPSSRSPSRRTDLRKWVANRSSARANESLALIERPQELPEACAADAIQLAGKYARRSKAASTTEAAKLVAGRPEDPPSRRLPPGPGAPEAQRLRHRRFRRRACPAAGRARGPRARPCGTSPACSARSRTQDTHRCANARSPRARTARSGIRSSRSGNRKHARCFCGCMTTSPVQPASTRVSSMLQPLLTLFEIEKALYELRYELRNRPDWASMPIAQPHRVQRLTVRRRICHGPAGIGPRGRRRPSMFIPSRGRNDSRSVPSGRAIRIRAARRGMAKGSISRCSRRPPSAWSCASSTRPDGARCSGSSSRNGRTTRGMAICQRPGC